jgi:methionyl-tRNA synthetase
MNKKPFYITTTLPYVNSEPHIGFAVEIVRADIIARYKKLQGFEVFFNTGTDEHGLKIYRKAIEKGLTPKQTVDNFVQPFKELLPVLGISEDVKFVRTTDEHHIMAAQEFWKICDRNGFIYKKNYKVKYCVGCELEKSDSDLVNGKCPDHPNLEIETIDEENYFFKFSFFQEKLLELYEKRTDFVVPDYRLKEINTFVKSGLSDFSISRLKVKMPWGIEVPGNPEQVMYVWFDALVNYISTLGWPDDMGSFGKWWNETGGALQYCGKDNLRQQSAMWQAMLMAANISPSKQIVIDGFVTGAGGIKMSKSLGNVVSPVDLVRDYGTEALRYYVTREVHPFEDTPFTLDSFKAAYNANLANGLGNLVNRIMKMAEDNLSGPVAVLETGFSDDFIAAMEKFNIQEATDIIWKKITTLDAKIQETQPFKLVKTDTEAGKKIIRELVEGLYEVKCLLEPIMPETSRAIENAVKQNKKPVTPLFLRKD